MSIVVMITKNGYVLKDSIICECCITVDAVESNELTRLSVLRNPMTTRNANIGLTNTARFSRLSLSMTMISV